MTLDGGASIGASAACLASAVPGVRVVPVAPEAANFVLLRRNTRGPAAECRHAALAGRPGRARIIDPGEGAWSFHVTVTEGGGGVPRVTVGGLPDEFAGEAFPFLVKPAIEGASGVTSGDTSWVERVPVIVIELRDWLSPASGTARPFLQRVAALDRDFVQNRGECDFRATGLSATVRPGGPDENPAPIENLKTELPAVGRAPALTAASGILAALSRVPDHVSSPTGRD